MYLKSVGLSELMVHGTLFASKLYTECPLMRGVRPRISLDIGQTSTQTPRCFIWSMMYGWRGRAKPWPIRFAPRRRASIRLPSVSVPMSSDSPQWKRKGISWPAALHRAWNCKNCCLKALSGLPLLSSPTKSKPGILSQF